MNVTVNGGEMELSSDATVLTLLELKNLPSTGVVVERNGDIVPGEAFAITALEDGDHLEVLRFVGGG
ncbi:MAG: sulfur carrier protein ThiS [Pseudodesulfovibrio sp.]|jgi:sulfur carrier protein|uniref:Sulfur carrier protein n=1 Tax=Pseudodesulfovibrio indicus TaxID=1716143 RepID=A0A126QMU8_9BACT|nr:sulfur carrier protein ThiS [Pseudodesulfovibrio indicus]AMK11410.1 thiamine biosynthesis protein ThiS [Pseudodesulfovibrio indicus]TDT89801.1 sulfur carrier protein [Pseudodesulfovibrio indicus]